jgi:hypothetical protein
MATRWAHVVVGTTLALGLTAEAWAFGSPSIAVVMYSQAGIPADTLAHARSEVARIYGDAGILVTWMDPTVAEPAGPFAIQLLLRRQPVGGSGSIMGTTIGDAHETSGTALIFYDRVLRTAHERQQDVSRVLAYAIAHEMGHLLLPHPAHSSSGIMRPHWDGDDLRHIASGSLQFTAVQANAIRTKVSGCCTATVARTSADLPLSKP